MPCWIKCSKQFWRKIIFVFKKNKPLLKFLDFLGANISNITDIKPYIFLADVTKVLELLIEAFIVEILDSFFERNQLRLRRRSIQLWFCCQYLPVRVSIPGPERIF